MSLRLRLTLFTVLLVVLVVAFTSLSTIFSLRYLLRQEMKTNQITLFNNFKEACTDALNLGDDLGIQFYSESLEKSVSGLAYAIFVDESRQGINLGGLESRKRFERLAPTCNTSEAGGKRMVSKDYKAASQKWRFYCEEMTVTNLSGANVEGTVYLGFNLDFLEAELKAIVARMWKTLIWAMLVVLLFGLLMAFILARRLTLPISHLSEGAKAIGDGNLDTQIPIESTDELGFLAQEFNLMAAKLKELDQLKDDFVSSVSHELRSPLSAISGYIELLRSKPLSEISEEKRNKALGIIQQSTDRLTNFINDILDLAKLKSGRTEIYLKELNIKHLSDDLIALYQQLLEKKGLSYVIDIAPDVPVIKADVDKVRHVLTNLVSNALKFTPSGGKIRISARNQTDLVQISVEDTGIGVPEKAKATIFERFKQADHGSRQVASADRPKGTGLGLAIARGIVEAHGGKIWIDSTEGKGTTVHFTLPHHAKAPIP